MGGGRTGGGGSPSLLRAQIAERHWQKFATFERRFGRAAKELAEREGEPSLEKITVSPRQFDRWYWGQVKTEPHPDACRVLEYMFGYPIRVLLAPAGDMPAIPATAATGGGEQVPLKHDPGHPGQGNAGDDDGLPLDSDLLPGEWDAEQTERLAGALECADIPVGADNALRLAHMWLVLDPPQVVEMRSGPRIGIALVEKIEGRVMELRRIDDFVGGGDLLRAVEFELSQTMTTMRGASYSSAVGVRLLAVIADLCQVAGWVASDAGRYRAAEGYYLSGARAAHAAGDAPLGGNLISSLSYQVSNVGDPAEAVLLASTAYQGSVRESAAAARALFLERLAYAHARAGNARLCERALGDAAENMARRSPGEDPEWTYWLDEREMDVMEGRCWTELRRPMRAEPILRRALSGYDESHSREVSLYLTWLAEDYVMANEIDEACSVAGRALALAAGVNSERARTRVGVVHELLKPYGSVRSVREFSEAFRQARRPVEAGLNRWKQLS